MLVILLHAGTICPVHAACTYIDTQILNKNDKSCVLPAMLLVAGNIWKKFDLPLIHEYILLVLVP
jgi:hypothetical protein